MITGAETAHLANRPGNIFLEGRLPLVSAPMARELGLRDGQVVEARPQAQGAGWSLQLPGGSVPLPQDAAASARLVSGEALRLRVQLLADGSVLLRPLSDRSPLAADPLLPNRSLQLMHRPPEPAALMQLLQPASLDQLLQQARTLSPELASSLQTWMRLRPAMSQLTPLRLQQILMHSGWMTEALLAQGRGAAQMDLKSTLRGLLKVLAGTSESRGLLQDAVDDIESRQLQAGETGIGMGKEWAISLVLPFVDSPPVQVRMAWRPPEGDSPSRFTLQLHTNSPELGDLWLQSQISGLSKVDLVMWADREDVARRAQARSASLAEELDSAGLQMTRLQVIHGRRPDSVEEARRPPQSGSMVDVAT